MEKLEKVLQDLLQEIENVIAYLKKEEKIVKNKKFLLCPKIIDFKYKDGGYISFSVQFESSEKEILSDIDLIEIRRLPSYTKSYKLISEAYEVDEFEAKKYLDEFIKYVITKLLNEALKNNELDRLIGFFLNDLESSPTTWDGEVGLYGLWLKDEKIEIGEGLKLRRPQPGDLISGPFKIKMLKCKLLKKQPIIKDYLEMNAVESVPPAILELTQKSSQPTFNEIEKLIVALRLYKLGSISCKRAVFKPRSVLYRNYIVSFEYPAPTVYSYSISLEESKLLKTFLEKMKSLFPIVEKNIKATNEISISLQRYTNALFESDSTTRLTYAIMGLESIFLRV
jgi:hypothetical protein